MSHDIITIQNIFNSPVHCHDSHKNRIEVMTSQVEADFIISIHYQYDVVECCIISPHGSIPVLTWSVVTLEINNHGFKLILNF